MRGCQGHAWLLGGMHRARRDTVNEWAVRILLECILVLDFFVFTQGHMRSIYPSVLLSTNKDEVIVIGTKESHCGISLPPCEKYKHMVESSM